MAYHNFMVKPISTQTLTDEEIQLLEEITQALENGPKEKIFSTQIKRQFQQNKAEVKNER